MRNYQTIYNVKLVRGNDRGVVRVRYYYKEGKFTLYAKMYNQLTGKLIHRSLNTFTNRRMVTVWAHKFIDSAVNSGAYIANPF